MSFDIPLEPPDVCFAGAGVGDGAAGAGVFTVSAMLLDTAAVVAVVVNAAEIASPPRRNAS